VGPGLALHRGYTRKRLGTLLSPARSDAGTRGANLEQQPAAVIAAFQIRGRAGPNPLKPSAASMRRLYRGRSDRRRHWASPRSTRIPHRTAAIRLAGRPNRLGNMTLQDGRSLHFRRRRPVSKRCADARRAQTPFESPRARRRRAQHFATPHPPPCHVIRAWAHGRFPSRPPIDLVESKTFNPIPVRARLMHYGYDLPPGLCAPSPIALTTPPVARTPLRSTCPSLSFLIAHNHRQVSLAR
jgi:hypothetical protein